MPDVEPVTSAFFPFSMLIPKFKAMRQAERAYFLSPLARRRQCETLCAAVQHQSRVTPFLGDTVKIATKALQWRSFHRMCRSLMARK
jgi:hypothetical protein